MNTSLSHLSFLLGATAALAFFDIIQREAAANLAESSVKVPSGTIVRHQIRATACSAVGTPLR
ncbi:hypothetical protein SB14R_10860 [Pseudomonas oryzihabitans]|nr:hypothetical protein SB14R_10860 [Pseudomonas psychrotolerans]KTT58724.1 hypothetical protein SB8_07275 [Pseudomonas psychrotolerans]